MPKTQKSYKNRFDNFRAGVCPYCGARGATLEHVTFGKERWVGSCGDQVVCKAMNNFTQSKCKVWAEG